MKSYAERIWLTVKVINNAAVAFNGFDGQIVRDTMKINYYGTVAATKTFLSLLRPEGRLVNVSSSAGKLHHLTPALAKRFSSANSIDDVTRIVQDFQDAVDAGREKEGGFKSAAYLTSKVALNAATRIIAWEQSEKGNTVLINCCNPGYVNVSGGSSCCFCID
jgi:carbonyl reductase 1